MPCYFTRLSLHRYLSVQLLLILSHQMMSQKRTMPVTATTALELAVGKNLCSISTFG